MECISKYQAYSALRSEAAEHEFPASKEAFERAARIIDQIPAADVRSVKRGKWIENAGYGGWGDTIYQCSECGIEWTCEAGISIDWNFCPNCGAKMDGGDSNV